MDVLAKYHFHKQQHLYCRARGKMRELAYFCCLCEYTFLSMASGSALQRMLTSNKKSACYIFLPQNSYLCIPIRYHYSARLTPSAFLKTFHFLSTFMLFLCTLEELQFLPRSDAPVISKVFLIYPSVLYAGSCGVIKVLWIRLKRNL